MAGKGGNLPIPGRTVGRALVGIRGQATGPEPVSKRAGRVGAVTAALRNRSNQRSDWKVISSDRLEFSIEDPDAVRSYPLQADALECRACAMDDLLQALGVRTSAFRHFSPDLFRHQPSEDSTPRQRTRPDPLATFFESKVVPILERRPDIDPITVFHNLRNSEPEFKPNYHRSLVDLDRDVAAFWHAALTELDGMIARIRAFSPPRRAIEKLAAKAKRSTLEHGGERKMGVKLRYADSYEEPELKPRDFGDWLPKIDFAFFSIPSLTQASTSGIFSSMAESNPRSALGTEALFADWVFALSVRSDRRLTPLDKQANATVLLPVPPSTEPLGAAPSRIRDAPQPQVTRQEKNQGSCGF